MRKFNISILIFSLFILSTNIFGETLDDCEKSNFTKCALGIKWGTEFEKPEILCPSIDKVEDWSNLDCNPIGSTQESRNKNHCSIDWCELAKQRKTSTLICAKKHFQFCYLGSNNSFQINPPDIRVILYALDLISLEDISNDTNDDKAFRITTYPTDYDNKNSNGVKARYISTWHNKVISYLSESVVPEKLEPKFFLIKAEEKYGKAQIKIKTDKLILGKYSDVLIWGGTTKEENEKKDGPPTAVHVLMSVPKRGEPPATIYSGTIDFYTIGEITKKLIEIDKNKREKQNKKNDEQLKKGGASVEF